MRSAIWDCWVSLNIIREPGNNSLQTSLWASWWNLCTELQSPTGHLCIVKTESNMLGEPNYQNFFRRGWTTCYSEIQMPLFLLINYMTNDTPDKNMSYMNPFSFFSPSMPSIISLILNLWSVRSFYFPLYLIPQHFMVTFFSLLSPELWWLNHDKSLNILLFNVSLFCNQYQFLNLSRCPDCKIFLIFKSFFPYSSPSSLHLYRSICAIKEMDKRRMTKG